MKQIVMILVSLSLLLPVVSAAQRVASMYGMGNDSCGAFTAALSRHQPSEVLTWEGEKWPSRAGAYVEWLLGFITAFNMTNSQGKNLDHADRAGLAAWLHKWCTEHPLEQLHQAAWTLVRERTGYDPSRDLDKSQR